jgi:ATP-dependent Clp protease ATP-binding subunit ClpX
MSSAGSSLPRSLGPVSLGLGSAPGKSARRERPTPKQTTAADPLLQVAKPKPARESFHFRLKPRDLKAHLDRFVIRQDEAKKVLSVALCDHFQHVRLCLEGDPAPHYVKQNVLLLGPTGVGKTHLIRSAAGLIGVPFVKADATKFSETGYVGGDVDDLIRDVIRKAGGDVERAQHGIVYLDEVDKLAGREAGTRDVSGRGVQTNLLKLMEDADVAVTPPGEHPPVGTPAGMARTINTRHILFIVSGAFAGLEDIIRRRLLKLPDTKEPAHIFDAATTQDFIEFGFEPEFVGRLPVRVACQPLSADDLYHVMRDSESSLLRQYERAFAAYGIRLKFRADGLRRIAGRAATENTGARGLMTVCERALRDFKFELPSTRITDLTVDAALVDNPGATLEQLLHRTGHRGARGA